MAKLKPADIARETLKLLASRKLTPTPTNYQAVYEEVAGLLPQVPFPQTPLRRIAAVLPTQTAIQKRLASHFSDAVENQDWTALQSVMADYAQLDLGLTPQVAQQEVAQLAQSTPTLPPSLAAQLARLIETTMTALGEEDHRMRDLSDQLVNVLRSSTPVSIQTLESMLHNYSYRLSFTSADQAQRHRCIYDMLRMVAEHIVDVSKDDQPVQRQALALASAMQETWSLQQLDQIQTRIKNLLFRHLEIEGLRTDAHERLKKLLTEHTAQMGKLGKLSEQHATQLQQCSEQIQQTHDLGSLAHALQTVVQSGSALATENRVVQAQLADLREQTQAQETQIALLSASLHEVEESARHDAETGALNAQGLLEAMQAEAGRSYETAHVTSMACLQIDQLPTLAQEFGTATVSNALEHVARVARSTLRPQDALARPDQTQFIVLFPNADPHRAVQALARLQAELQLRPLCLDEHLLTLSFSAGVIAISSAETSAENLQRAAAAFEQAQRMGVARITSQ